MKGRAMRFLSGFQRRVGKLLALRKRHPALPTANVKEYQMQKATKPQIEPGLRMVYRFSPYGLVNLGTVVRRGEHQRHGPAWLVRCAEDDRLYAIADSVGRLRPATPDDERHFDKKNRGRVSRNRITVHQPTTLDDAQSPRHRTTKRRSLAKTDAFGAIGFGEQVADAIEEELEGSQ